MPELPEVEITRLGIAAAVEGRRIERLEVRESRLRWPIPRGLKKRLEGQYILSLKRRGKYLLFDCGTGILLMHLGMSGSLCYRPRESPLKKHDHFIMHLQGDISLRFCDPRRFGCVLWTVDPEQHKLLKDLGPEPLADEFNGQYLYQQSRKRKVVIKNLIMNSKIVVGVGNIYASESLFESGIRPTRSSAKLTRLQSETLVQAIKTVLRRSIKAGGTTLRDFSAGQGQPGYFQQQLKVYDREGLACVVCGGSIKRKLIGQRSSYYCGQCQK